MISSSWYRIVSVQIGSSIFDSEVCDIEFKIEKSDESNQNQAEITLWNLDANTMNGVVADTPVRIKAGYKGDFGVIFEGYVTKKEPEADGADTSTIITCSDASLLLYESKEFIAEVSAGQKLSTVVKKVYDTCSIPVGQIDETDYSFLQARTFLGTGQAILEELLKIVNGNKEKYAAYTERGMGYFVRSDHKSAEVFEINSSTGLLTAEKNEDSTSGTNAKLKTLLNWKIKTDSWLRVTCPNVNGLFKVSGYTHTLKGEVFETDMEVKAAWRG